MEGFNIQEKSFFSAENLRYGRAYNYISRLVDEGIITKERAEIALLNLENNDKTAAFILLNSLYAEMKGNAINLSRSNTLESGEKIESLNNEARELSIVLDTLNQ